MFCKDLARLFLFIISLCFWAVCDYKQADLWYYWDFAFRSFHFIQLKAKLNSTFINRGEKEEEEEKLNWTDCRIVRSLLPSFLFLTISKLLNIINRLSAHRLKCYIFFSNWYLYILYFNCATIPLSINFLLPNLFLFTSSFVDLIEYISTTLIQISNEKIYWFIEAIVI